ncbi:MAG TPA: hypothetical protein VIH43_04710, partial [Chthoniobacterales bacterium]
SSAVGGVSAAGVALGGSEGAGDPACAIALQAKSSNVRLSIIAKCLIASEILCVVADDKL